jgi:hypothetical protein
METRNVKVELFTIPQAACDSGKANWEQVAEMVKNQIASRFGEEIGFIHIEFMSEQWFKHLKAQDLLEKGEANFPFVLVNDEIACADKKINVSKVNKAIQLKLQQ